MFQIAPAKASVPLVERFLGGRERVISSHDFERELLFGFERMHFSWRGASKEQVIIVRHQSSEMLISFPNISDAGSLIATKLPRLLLIFLDPSKPSRMGRRKTTCCGKPSSFWNSRPTRILKS